MKNKPVKIRRGWGINPKTRIVESKKQYKRQLSKKELKRVLQQEDF